MYFQHQMNDTHKEYNLINFIVAKSLENKIYINSRKVNSQEEAIS